MAASEHKPGVARIRTAMIEKKLTQTELADAADCHEKTIQNLMHGRPVRDQTLFDVCMVLGLDFDEVKAAWTGASERDEPGRPALGKDVAPVYMGAYTRAAVDDYIGSYLTLRPSFGVRSSPTAPISLGTANGRACCFRSASVPTPPTRTAAASTCRPPPCSFTSSH
jgi:transcriptional regulator with XRE-family HTH domain